MKPLSNEPGRGVLFQQTDKTNDKAPDYRGGVNIDGVEYEIAAWGQVSKRGMPYLSLVLKPQQDHAAAANGRPDDADIDRAFARGYSQPR